MADLNLKAGTNMSIRQEDTDLYLDNTYEYDDTQIQEDLLKRSLITETGKTIELTLNNTNYKMTAILKDKYGNVISTSNEIDLPIESLVVSIYYDQTTKELVFVLKDGTTTRVPLLDLIDGLATEEDLETLEDNVNNTIQTFEDDINEDMETFKGDVEQELEKAQQDLSMYKMLENALPKVEGEGENITLDGTAQTPMHLNFKGQIQQASTTGKNLLKYPYYSTSKTENGITWTVNDDGSIKIKGTATNNSFFQLYSSTSLKLFTDTTKTYTIQIGELNNSIVISCFDYVNGSVARFREDATFYECGVTFIPTTNGEGQLFRLSIQSGATLDTTIFPIIVEGSYTDTKIDYEPFTGNSPSPSPSYPQDIHIVSGDNEIKVENKNLLDNSSIIANTNCSVSNKIITSSTLSNWDNFICKISDTPLEPNVDYYVTTQIKLISGTMVVNYIGALYNGRATTSRTMVTNPNLTNEYQTYCCKIKTNEEGFIGKQFFFQCSTSNNGVISVKDIILSKEPNDSYVEHQEYTKEINLPVENLANVTITGQVPSLTNGSLVSLSGSACTDYLIIDNSKEYTFSYSINNTAIPYITFYGENDSYLGYSQVNNSGYKLSSSTYFSTTKKIRLRFDQYERYDTIQLEKGSKANSYTPYGTTPIEVGGIGEYEDEFFKNTIDSEYYDSTLLKDKWYLKKRIGKVVLDGSENWNNDSGTQGTDYRHNINVARLNISTPVNINKTYMSNYFISRNIASDSGELGTFYLSNIWLVFVDKNKVYDLENWKAWLSTHNPIIDYVLATPTNTLLNDTLQETLDSFYSWQEQTNISQENNDLPFVIKASAIYDLSNLVTRVATLETE